MFRNLVFNMLLYTGKPVIKVIVSLPTSLNQKQYEDYKDVFYSIGFAKIDFVYNCVCASLDLLS